MRDNELFDIDEPFKKLLTQGMVQSAAYKNNKTGKYVSPSDITDLSNPIDPIDNSKLEVLFEKMSKSKYNGIDPESVIKKYGADTARMFILFKAPPEKDLEWEGQCSKCTDFLNPIRCHISSAIWGANGANKIQNVFKASIFKLLFTSLMEFDNEL